MRKFDYVIKDESGIHARPAGLLVKLAKELDSTVTVEKNGKCVDATKLLSIMQLAAVKGDKITVSILDGDEEKSEKILKEFFESNL